MASYRSNCAAPICIREVSTTSFIFKIYMKAYPSIKSAPIFTSGGHDWRLKWNISSTKELQLWLVLITEDHEVKATIDFSLLEKNGDISSEHQRVSHTFSSKRRYTDMALPIRNMYPANYVTNDYFNVLCTIFIAGDTTKAELNQSSSGLLTDGLVKNINNLLLSQDMSDVTFEVDGEIFHAHRLILATRSPVFKAELFGQMLEGNKECIKLEGIMAKVFKDLLRYIYTDTIQDHGTKFNQHLLEAADRYAVDGLRKICEDRLCRDISLDTVLSSLALADQHNCGSLLDSCLNFAANPENLLQLILRQEYLDLMKSCPSVFAKLTKRTSASLAFKKIIYKK